MKFIAGILILGLFFHSCFIDSEIEYVEKEPDFVEFSTTVTGFSGMCPTKDNNNFLALSDKLGIYEITRTGTTIRKLPLENGHDFEAIAIDPASSDIYLADEEQLKVFQLQQDEKAPREICKINIDGGLFNKGLEGIAFGKDTLYIVNQDSPVLLIKFSLKTNMETTRIKPDFGVSLSEVFYDETDHTLWFLDSMERKLYHATVTGKRIAGQDISVVAKPEALYLDRKAKMAWIGCDQTLFLYRIKLKI